MLGEIGLVTFLEMIFIILGYVIGVILSKFVTKFEKKHIIGFSVATCFLIALFIKPFLI